MSRCATRAPLEVPEGLEIAGGMSRLDERPADDQVISFPIGETRGAWRNQKRSPVFRNGPAFGSSTDADQSPACWPRSMCTNTSVLPSGAIVGSAPSLMSVCRLPLVRSTRSIVSTASRYTPGCASSSFASRRCTYIDSPDAAMVGLA